MDYIGNISTTISASSYVLAIYHRNIFVVSKGPFTEIGYVDWYSFPTYLDKIS